MPPNLLKTYSPSIWDRPCFARQFNSLHHTTPPPAHCFVNHRDVSVLSASLSRSIHGFYRSFVSRGCHEEQVRFARRTDSHAEARLMNTPVYGDDANEGEGRHCWPRQKPNATATATYKGSSPVVQGRLFFGSPTFALHHHLPFHVRVPFAAKQHLHQVIAFLEWLVCELVRSHRPLMPFCPLAFSHDSM
jgi:hypothetical protein